MTISREDIIAALRKWGGTLAAAEFLGATVVEFRTAAREGKVKCPPLTRAEIDGLLPWSVLERRLRSETLRAISRSVGLPEATVQTQASRFGLRATPQAITAAKVEAGKKTRVQPAMQTEAATDPMGQLLAGQRFSDRPRSAALAFGFARHPGGQTHVPSACSLVVQ